MIFVSSSTQSTSCVSIRNSLCNKRVEEQKDEQVPSAVKCCVCESIPVHSLGIVKYSVNLNLCRYLNQNKVEVTSVINSANLHTGGVVGCVSMKYRSIQLFILEEKF
jgi:hypothetical protein